MVTIKNIIVRYHRNGVVVLKASEGRLFNESHAEPWLVLGGITQVEESRLEKSKAAYYISCTIAGDPDLTTTFRSWYFDQYFDNHGAAMAWFSKTSEGSLAARSERSQNQNHAST